VSRSIIAPFHASQRDAWVIAVVVVVVVVVVIAGLLSVYNQLPTKTI
jgi:hypothetical protein